MAQARPPEVPGLGQAARPRRRMVLQPLQVPDGIADGAQPLEVGLAGEIEGAGRRRPRRREQYRAQADPRARHRQGWIARGQPNARPLRHLGRLEPRQHKLVQQHAPAAVARLGRQHLAGHGERTEFLLQHRGGHQGRAHLGRRKARRHRAQVEPQQPEPGPPTAQNPARKRHGQQRPAQPAGRLDPQQEIDRNAQAEADWQPEHPTLPLGQHLPQYPVTCSQHPSIPHEGPAIAATVEDSQPC